MISTPSLANWLLAQSYKKRKKSCWLQDGSGEQGCCPWFVANQTSNPEPPAGEDVRKEQKRVSQTSFSSYFTSALSLIPLHLASKGTCCLSDSWLRLKLEKSS